LCSFKYLLAAGDDSPAFFHHLLRYVMPLASKSFSYCSV
jgi:hypothetical protein